MNVACNNCSKEFYKKPSAIKRTKNNFCSHSCAASFNNRIEPKRKKKNKCLICETSISYRNKYCSSECRSQTWMSETEAKEIQRLKRIDRRRAIKQKCVAYLGGKCQVCHYNKCLSALQFHHLNPNEKDFTIGGKTLSWTKTKVELDKCKLLCANCHAELHEAERNS